MRQHAHLFRREPEREIAGVMLDQKADEPFMRAERRAMDAQRRLLGIVAVAVVQAELRGHGEIHLVRGQRELAADDAPDLHVNLRAVKRRFVRHFDVVDAVNQSKLCAPCPRSCSTSSGSLTNFLPSLPRSCVLKRITIFFDAENLEILQIHLVDRIELCGELFLACNKCARRSCSANARA